METANANPSGKWAELTPLNQQKLMDRYPVTVGGGSPMLSIIQEMVKNSASLHTMKH